MQEAELSVPGPSGWGNIVINKVSYRTEEHEVAAQHFTNKVLVMVQGVA